MFLRRVLSSSSSFRRGVSSQAVSELAGRPPAPPSVYTPNLNFFNSVTPDGSLIPTYRVLDGVGVPLEGAEVPQVRQLSAQLDIEFRFRTLLGNQFGDSKSGALVARHLNVIS